MGVRRNGGGKRKEGKGTKDREKKEKEEKEEKEQKRREKKGSEKGKEPKGRTEKMGGTAIEIRGLTKNYGKHRGVEDISLTVEEGDIFGFLGPNGAGKSTTIRSMLGMLRFRQGEITLLGKDCRKSLKEILRQIGYMPSESAFYADMRVAEVIRFAADARGLDCGEEAARLCGLLEVDMGKRIRELSLGNRKKVSIVCAMQHRPRLLILDEPTSGLDPLMQEVFFRLLLEYNARGTTVFLSSHVLSEVRRYCRNAAIIRRGRIVRRDTVESLSKSDLRRVWLRENGQEKEFTYTGSMQELIRGLAGRNIEDLLIREPSLDELFLHYYEETETDSPS